MKIKVSITAATFALGLSGCALGPKLPPMSAGTPIEIDTSPGKPRYTQGGEAIDPSDMVSKLDKEPESSGHVNGARAAKVIGVLMGGAGGAMLGWPLGRAAGGDPNPNWALAGAGGGVAAAGLILAVASAWIMDDAVRAHNKALTSPSARSLQPVIGPVAWRPGPLAIRSPLDGAPSLR